MLTTPEAPPRRSRLDTIPGWALLAVAATIAFAWLAWSGGHTHIFSNDEDQYVYLSRWFPQHLPESIWNFDVYERGLQRFEIWLLAVPALVLDSPWSLVGRPSSQHACLRIHGDSRVPHSHAGLSSARAGRPFRPLSPWSCRGPL